MNFWNLNWENTKVCETVDYSTMHAAQQSTLQYTTSSAVKDSNAVVVQHLQDFYVEPKQQHQKFLILLLNKVYNQRSCSVISIHKTINMGSTWPACEWVKS